MEPEGSLSCSLKTVIGRMSTYRRDDGDCKRLWNMSVSTTLHGATSHKTVVFAYSVVWEIKYTQSSSPRFSLQKSHKISFYLHMYDN
jgi:hypothetical protein